MSKRTNLTLLFVLLLSPAAARAQAADATARLGFGFVRALVVGASDREQDGLSGPVRRVKTETAKITVKNGKPVEGARAVLETTTYDQKGTRVDNAYFLEAGGSLTGKEVYKYDERGNIVEMTLRNDDGTLLSKEVYTYEFDAVGNWVKMTTSVAIIEGGQVTFEPSEVTYRTISYYLDEATMAKMSQPATQNQTQAPAAQPATQPAQQQTAAHAANSGAQLAAQPKPSPAASNTATQTQPKPQNKVTATPAAVSLDKSVVAANAPAPVVTSVVSSAGGPSVKADDAEAPARPARSGPLKPISGGILNGKALSLPAPAYPEVAKHARLMGTVEVEVVIDTNGKVISANAVKGPALLRQAAEQAAKMAKFTPTLLTGQPVKVTGIITYNFTLQ